MSSKGNTHLQPVFEALKCGAVDYMNKPNGNKSKIREMSEELVQKVKSVSRSNPKKVLEIKKETLRHKSMRFLKSSKYEIIAIGASTGGSTAIESIINELPDDFNIPVIICQHMSQGFIPSFMQWLNAVTNLEVAESTKGMSPKSGDIMFCPGHSNLYFTK